MNISEKKLQTISVDVVALEVEVAKALVAKGFLTVSQWFKIQTELRNYKI